MDVKADRKIAELTAQLKKFQDAFERFQRPKPTSWVQNGAGGGAKHAITNAGGVPPKVGYQMGHSTGIPMRCDDTGLLDPQLAEAIELYNPSTGPVSGNADIVYAINDAGLAVILVEDCAIGNCSDTLPVVTSTGPFTKPSASGTQTIALTGTGTILSWGVTGTLPPGMARVGTGSSVTITGVPTTPGTYSVVITASNCAGSAAVTISITIT